SSHSHLWSRPGSPIGRSGGHPIWESQRKGSVIELTSAANIPRAWLLDSVGHRTLLPAGSLARSEGPQNPDCTLGGIGECVSDEGVVSRLSEPHLEYAP